MDGGGCLAEPVMRSGPARPTAPWPASAASARRRGSAEVREQARRKTRPIRRRDGIRGWLEQHLDRLDSFLPPRGWGVAASALILLSSLAYGTVRGGHLPVVLAVLVDARDMAANAVGFHIAGVALTGNKHMTREEVLATAGITGRTSLLFLDVADVRARLLAHPWIADATVQKLYPDRLQLAITEREAFALWQKDGRLSVIAADGTVLEPYLSRRFVHLPLFVGIGAETRAKDFLALLDRYPSIRDRVQASVLVAERRWNLRLKNGIDVRLPEHGIEESLDQLVMLDQTYGLLSRDITAVDLRLPDRVSVRLSDAAAQAREEALRPRKPKAKGGNA